MQPADLNRLLSEMMGKRIRVGYRGGAPLGLHGGGSSDPAVGRIHLQPDWYKAIAKGAGAPKLPLAMGILGHELGHHSPQARAYKGVLNPSGGMDYDPAVPERLGDEWAYANMARLYKVLGYTRARRLAGQSSQALRKYRSKHPLI